MKNLSFELNEGMMQTIENDFSPEKIGKEYCNLVKDKNDVEIEKIGVNFFKNYGQKLMEKSLDLGERFPDRTYEILRENADRTNSMYFPLIPQRFIEIAFLSIQRIPVLKVIENNSRNFLFKVENCKVYKNVEKNCGNKIARLMLCRHGCLELCRIAFKGFGINQSELKFDMLEKTNEKGFCLFQVSKMGGKFEWKNFPEKIIYAKKKRGKITTADAIDYRE